jgi:GTPase SAR1 family protein
VKEHHDSVMRVKWETENFPFVLCGNKCDMEAQRQVTTEAGVELSQKLGVRFLETSAKTGKNVSEAFHELVREIKKWRQAHPNTKGKSAPTQSEKTKKRRTCTLL